VESISGIEAVDYENTLAIAVVIFGDCFILVLACSVPNLQFDFGPINFDDFVNIIDADGHHVILYEFSLAIPKKDIALSYSRVSDDDNLHEVIEGLILLVPRFHPLTLNIYQTNN